MIDTIFIMRYVNNQETYIEGVFSSYLKAHRYREKEFGGSRRYKIEEWDVDDFNQERFPKDV